jgi:Fur family ferric uptake transcriptional regulator/Fur family peroxide stress response transcriptional regulator
MAVIKRHTAQKELVKSIALSACDHPTAETVFANAKKSIPNISLATVYRILNELVCEGALREVYVPGAPSRFDKTTYVHAHFVCKKCGLLEDMEVPLASLIENAEMCGNLIDGAEIMFKGICQRCREDKA